MRSLKLDFGYGMYLVPNPKTTFCTRGRIKDDMLNIAVFVIVEYLSTNLFSLDFLVSSLLSFS